MWPICETRPGHSSAEHWLVQLLFGSSDDGGEVSGGLSWAGLVFRPLSWKRWKFRKVHNLDLIDNWNNQCLVLFDWVLGTSCSSLPAGSWLPSSQVSFWTRSSVSLLRSLMVEITERSIILFVKFSADDVVLSCPKVLLGALIVLLNVVT